MASKQKALPVVVADSVKDLYASVGWDEAQGDYVVTVGARGAAVDPQKSVASAALKAALLPYANAFFADWT